MEKYNILMPAKVMLKTLRPGITFSFLSAAMLAAAADAAPMGAPYGDDDDYRDGVALPDNIDKLVGVDVNNTNSSLLATTGNPMVTTATISSQSELMKRIFVMYNIGARKFLSAGSWWDTHATLSDAPKLFWLQRRNEKKTLQTQEVRYPDDGNELVLQSDVSNPDLSTVNAAINDDKSGVKTLTQLQVGSQEGAGRSHATYTKMQHIRTAQDGTETVVKDLLADKGAEYKPAGEKFCFDVKDFNILTDKIVVSLDMADCYNNNNGKADKNAEGILSIGNAIANWNFSGSNAAVGAGEYNIHMYYNSQTKGLEVDYVDATARYGGDGGNYGSGKARSTIANVRGNATITFSKDGISVSDLSPLTLRLPYVAERAGDIANFKYNADGTIYINNENEYEIDETGSGKPFSTNYNSYMYTINNADGNTTWFISSKIENISGASLNEGKFMGYAPYDSGTWQLGNGTRGCFIDRDASDQYKREMVQWSFEPVAIPGETGNVYNISLSIPYDESTGQLLEEKDADGHVVRQKFWLEADKSYVTGSAANKTASPDHYYHIADTEHDEKIDSDYDTAELHTAIDKTNPNNCWKIISLDEYTDLVGGAKSEMENPVEMTYMLSDPDFARENGGLRQWQMDPTLESASALASEAKLRIGFDGYYKTSTTQQDYFHDADQTGEHDNSGNGMLINHSQHMCAQILNGGRGRLYQDVAVYYPGWYELRCQGMTNVDAKLFVQRMSGIGQGATALTEPISKDLKRISADGLQALRHPTTSGLHWPYDCDMLMYNAGVEMNDEDLPVAEGDEEQPYMKYRNYVLIYIDKVNDELVSRQNPCYLRFGINVEQGAENVAESEECTLFDNFHLLFGGKSEEPNLILSEEETNLDYLDNSMHIYDNKPMHLYRTFTKDVWNTLMLPVQLTKEQFDATFGSGSKLARLYELTASTVRFTYVSAENPGDVMVEAFKPYIIFPATTSGASTEYTANLVRRDNPSKSITKTCPDQHYLVESVTLPYEENEASGEMWYNFGGLDKYNAAIDGKRCSYVVDANSSGSYGSGSLHCYGTLCKTFEQAAEGGNSYGLKILDGRPRLDDGNAYIMKGGTMYRVPEMASGYGLKGFRCWFQYVDSSAEAKQQTPLLLINGISDDATTIDSINAADGVTTISRFADGVYTLGGQKVGDASVVGRLKGGLYIVNGKKYMAR